jgi:hypothetical protein
VLLADHVADDAVNGAAYFSLAPLGPIAGDGSFFIGDLGLTANGLAARGLATGVAAIATAAVATSAAAAVTCQGGAGDHGRQATREDERQQLAHGCSSVEMGYWLEL